MTGSNVSTRSISYPLVPGYHITAAELGRFITARTSRYADLLGIGTVMRGRFGGKLMLYGKRGGQDLSTYYWRSHLGCALPRCGSIVRPSVSPPQLGLQKRMARPSWRCRIRSHFLVDPASSLVLVYEIPTLTLFHAVDDWETSEWSFNFSKFPNLQEADFGFRVGSRRGYLP